jgi:hypothetical protein
LVTVSPPSGRRITNDVYIVGTPKLNTLTFTPVLCEYPKVVVSSGSRSPPLLRLVAVCSN